MDKDDSANHKGLSVGQRAARTRKHRAAAFKAHRTRKKLAAWQKAHAAEAQSKQALQDHLEEHGWQIAYFEGKTTRAPRTGIIDGIAFRLVPRHADVLEVRLIQVKGGKAGITAGEITRLKKAAVSATVNWLIAEYDGDALEFLPDDPTN